MTPHCETCGQLKDWEICWQCDGAGVYGHECGDDCCACLDPEENEPCDECDGAGGYWTCAGCQG